MKKLLLILLCLPLLFSTCKKEDEEPSLAIGDTHQGGVIFYLDGNGGGLIAAPTGQGKLEWGCWYTYISGADGTGIGNGSQNTIDIQAGCSTSGTAADICASLTLEGYSDWFLPSKDELNEMYLNKAAIGDFVDNYYWSSTEHGNCSAWGQSFGHGGQLHGNKNLPTHVHAIRAF